MTLRMTLHRAALVLLLVLSGSTAFAQAVATVHTELTRYTSTPTVGAVQSGAWSDRATWGGGAVPGDRARVFIPNGITVTVDRQIATAYDWLRVDGTLRFQPDVNTELIVETLVAHGLLEMGTASNPIAATVRARLLIRSPQVAIDHAVDPLELSRGLIAMSPVSIYGSPKREISSLAVLPAAGATCLELDADPIGWVVGDEILVAPSVYGQDEVVTVTSISGRTIGISPALKFTRTNVPAQPKIGPPVAYKVHVGNLTRNAVVQTDPANAAAVRNVTPFQGHVMLMGGGHRIFNAAFIDTGRTTVKTVTDPIFNADGTRNPQLMPLCGVTVENVRGRYSLHFHNPGPTSAASNVDGVVVRTRRNMGLKIGIQNHSAHIIGRRIVSHQIDGSHLFTEEGDEQGEYTDSMSVHSFGSNHDKNVQPGGSCPSLNYPEIHNRRRRDMGHMGAGVWLQGNLVKLDGSIYAGHDHAAIDHSAQGLDIDGKNNFVVLVRPSTLPEGLWWLEEGKYAGKAFDPNAPLFRVAIPVWILKDLQIYAIGKQKNAHKVAIAPKFTTDLPNWAPRPKNIFKNILAWNVWGCVDTEYSPWGILEDFTCVAGDVKLWGAMPHYRRTGVATFRQLVGGRGWWVYRNVRIDGFMNHKDSGLPLASASLGLLPAGVSRYEGVWIDGVPYLPSGEVCDGLDNDGDGLIDEGCLPEPPHPLDPLRGIQDTTPPVITLGAPTPVTLQYAGTVEASDASAIVRIDVLLNGQLIQQCAGPCTYTVDLAPLAPGTHTITAIVADAYGNTAQSSVTVER